MKFKKYYFEDVNVKSVDLKAMYDKFNKELFNGELHDIPIRTGNLKRVGGEVRAYRVKMQGEWIIVNKEMVISAFFNKKDIKAIEAILLHEMIHVYMNQNQIEDIDGMHGFWFKKKVKELQPKVDFEIPLIDNLSTTISDHIKSKKLDVVLFQHPNYYSISLLKGGILEKPFISIGTFAQEDPTGIGYLIDRYDHKVVFDGYTIYFLQSDEKELLKYPVASKYSTMKYFRIEDDFAKRLLETGKLLLKLDKKELKKRLEGTKDYKSHWEKYFTDVE